MERNIIVFEVAWEVANKVGGIYTVLSTKAPFMKKEFHDFFVVGPYNKRQAAVEFEDEEPSAEFEAVFNSLENDFGIKCYSGHWLVTDRPKCLLVDPADFKKEVNNIKREFWDIYRIDSLGASEDYNEPIIWAKAAGLLLERLIEDVFAKEFDKSKCVVHCHEWLSAGALLHLRHYKPEIKTVFTTHATVLGRTIAEAGEALYDEINNGLARNTVVDDGRAYKYGVQAKHLTEKACAHAAHVFTTVSEITAKEAEYLLAKKPDLITPNGLNVERFYLMEELANLHVKYRNVIRRFVLDYFAPYYYINVEDSLFYFISGRYEMRNKGIDLFIDALAELNKKLKRESKQTIVVAFIWVPAPNRGKNIELLKHMSLYERIEDEIEEEVKKIKNRLYYAISRGEPPSEKNLLDEEFLYKIKKMLFELKHEKNELPPISVLDVDENDAILQRIISRGLLNREEDKVKVIYYPTYLSSADGLIGLEYYHAVIGCHLGVFPSYYEPWGYTPLETIALGLPAVTTDLSGFGRYVLKNISATEAKDAIKVIRRENVPYEESLKELTDFMYRIYMMPRRERGEAKIRAKRISYLFSWEKLISNYIDAYDIAFQRD